MILIHGVLCDHSVWALQSRYLANHGWNVLAIDLPGHCRAQGAAPAERGSGAPPSSASSWTLRGWPKAALHWPQLGQPDCHGGGRQPCKTASAIWCWWARPFPMKVSPALLESALHTARAGHAHGQHLLAQHACPRPTALARAPAVFGAGMALGRRVLVATRGQRASTGVLWPATAIAGGEAAMDRNHRARCCLRWASQTR